MVIFYEYKETGLSCGINDSGDLFMGDNASGYNLKDTEENRNYIISDYRYNLKMARHFRGNGRN